MEKEKYKENILNLNEIIAIANIIGETEHHNFDVKNIGMFEKIYNFKKYEVSNNDTDQEVYFGIKCSDKRNLYITFKSHFGNPKSEYDTDYHLAKMTYTLNKDSILRFDANLNDLFKDNNITNIYDALRKISTDDLVYRENNTHIYENLCPFYIEFDDTRVVNNKFLDWDELKKYFINGETSNEIIKKFDKSRFTREELIHLTFFIDCKVKSLENEKAPVKSLKK